MNSADVFEQIELMGELPSLPQSLLKIQKVATDDRSCADDLANCILKDQALTMRVLKVVNSALYQRRGQEKVRTVRRAVIVMGFETVRKLALGLSVFDMMSKLSRSPWLAVITRHSLITAAFAQILAESTTTVHAEEAFVTALIHDIGKVVLLECSPAAMDEVLADLSGGIPALEAERRHFGITHDRAGRRLSARWGLPVQLQNVIGDHHDIDPLSPPKNLDPLLACIVFANAMSRFTFEGKEQSQEYKILRKAGRSLGIPSNKLDQVYSRVVAEVENLADCLGMDMGDLEEFGAVVNKDGSIDVAPRSMSEEEISARTAQQLKLYRQVGQGLASGQEPQQLVNLILEGAVEILGFERVVLLEADRENHNLVSRYWAGFAAEELAHFLDLPLKRSSGALALTILEHRDFHVPDALNPAYGPLAGEELLRLAQCRGYGTAAIRTTDNNVWGVIYADGGAKGQDVSAEQAHELSGLAQQIGLIFTMSRKSPV
ncbi:MAG: HDOD domain-containing protein [bacterium]|nr:HDOD domain-containing protein [bacterium]